MTLSINNRGLISLKGKSLNLETLNAVQAQNVLIKLGFDVDCLFDILVAFEKNDWNTTELGLCGSFIYGEKK